MAYLYLYLILGVVFGLLCRRAALEKDRNGRTWFWLGFFLSIPAFLVLLLLPEGGPHRQCPRCGRRVPQKAVVCGFCGTRLDRSIDV
ncbi:MAG: zinc ribbon domain-containing protein [Firmicutes bacterium]|nr:zinc ribbon domain-containing protein [Bacillota bacterium]